MRKRDSNIYDLRRNTERLPEALQQMTTNLIFEYIQETAQSAASELIKTYFNQGGKMTPLVFPQSPDNFKRVSEQEFRYAFIHAMSANNRLGLTFSIETPTENKYAFKGVSRRSASSDLSLYNDSGRIINIEFKSGNPNPSSISKDIEKLIKENCHGVWSHILRNENSGTLKCVFQKIKKAFQIYGPPQKPFFFSFLILGSQRLITRGITESDLSVFHADTFFNIDYYLYKSLTENEIMVDGWLIKSLKL